MDNLGNHTVNPVLAADDKYDILLVENSYVIQRLTLRMLTEYGHSIESAENGILGLDPFKDRVLQNKPFDVILAARYIRVYEMQYDLSPKPIIALAYTTIGHRELWHQAGMDYIMTHPIWPVELLDAIRWAITETGVVP
ncbi:hypothetical protein DFH07DRAFT_948307 [Mycena maculata]|uniref:Response regulatory domain-containing protein n=1 Tax=Mycena maculata TaxID=230809 RepID=A0AAD7KGQ6_9AGAR|nr:hypothetical protein DFH07DRAFT_948307 [Mycena maculata]